MPENVKALHKAANEFAEKQKIISEKQQASKKKFC